MTITLTDVAQLAGVSRSAVSRTFTPGASVSPATRARVRAAAETLGYSPNVLARALTTRQTHLIGLVSDNFHNPIFLEVFDLFTRGLQARGLRPLLVNLSGDGTPDPAQILRQYSVDGVVVASSTLPPGFLDAAVPVVHSFGRPSTAPRVDTVGIDNLACGRLAAATLLARGYTQVAFLGGPARATSAQDRLEGLAQGLAGHARLTHSFANAYTFDAGRAEMQRLLAIGPPAQAYFCGDDVVAIGALSALRDHGLRVPQDVGVLGVNDMEMAGWASIALTTIRQPVAEIIETSLTVMAGMLSAPDHRPQSRVLPCTITERSTLRPL